MTNEQMDDLHYVCVLIEYVGRKTHNKISDVVKSIGKKGLLWQLKNANTSHCLSFEQMSDELIEKHNIFEGEFDSVGRCKYDVPSHTAIGAVYKRLIAQVMEPEDDVVDVMYDVFCSFISEEISNFNTSVYYSNPDYLKHSYLQGELLSD